MKTVSSISKQWFMLFIFCIACTLVTVAQGPGGIGTGLGGGISPDDQQSQANHQGTSVPLDLGIGIMAAAGIAYSAKKARDKKRNFVK